jgi:phage replication-related protein YjqB (UPF0714/DUF867 family)
MLDELLRTDGVTEQLELRSRVGFLALHGGSLEKGTDVVAAEAAARAGASLYAVRQPADLRWHVPSTAFDPAHSVALATMLAHCDVVISVHGFGRAGLFTTVLIGGRNRRLAEHVASAVRPALAGYEVVDDITRVPRELAGQHPDNPVNRSAGGGVQLELPPRVRGIGPYWESRRDEWRAGRSPHTDALIDALADAARSWPEGEARADAGPRPGR